MTKPPNVPKPVCGKKSGGTTLHTLQTPTPSTSTDAHADETSVQKTITTPAMTQETHDAIDVLLLLGTIGVPPNPPVDPEDNKILMPIGGNSLATDDILPSTNEATGVTVNSPKSGTELGEAINNDNVEELDVAELDNNKQPENDDPNPENKDNTNTDGANQNSKAKDNIKKRFVTRQFGLKRRTKPQRKFKCGVCATKLDTVHDYNQHYLDNHLPTPCPYCPRVFTSPWTMTKHQYSHAETMFKCETCGQGFSFRSQYLSHCKVHLTIQGFVFFKAKCRQRFKRESELNAHLKAHK